jgi:hypothetical protein
MTITITMEGLRALAGQKPAPKTRAVPKTLPTPAASTKTGAEIRLEAQALLQRARDLFEEIRELPEARDAHDGLRIIAATIGARIVVRRRKGPANTTTPVDYGALCKQIESLVGDAIGLVKGRLPERRDWIFQNATELFREGIWALQRKLAPQVPRTHAKPSVAALPAVVKATG